MAQSGYRGIWGLNYRIIEGVGGAAGESGTFPNLGNPVQDYSNDNMSPHSGNIQLTQNMVKT